ncbi:glycosyltransferase family 2 protein [Effusibacillus consociatus]|uniref:Glycosyltransferase family 2 protein n=1 Tax=Effusibacillus consociatus TaxID=1117041 RepID=A0ABV9PU74_9BACL
MNPLISIIIPLFNQYQVTEQCLNSIFKKTGIPYELILIDNGSTDGTREKISRLEVKDYDQLKNLQIIYNRDNLGVAKAWNQGIKQANGDFICICNNDIVVSKNWLPPLVEQMRSNLNLGMVSPVENFYIRVHAGRNQFPEEYEFLSSRPGPQPTLESLDEYYNGFERFAASFTEKYRSQQYFDELFSIVLIRKELFEEIGLFEEGFGLAFWEDVDFVQRTLLSEKFSDIMVYPGSYVHHYGNVTSSLFIQLGSRQFESSAVNFTRKWGDVGDSIYQKLKMGSLNSEEMKRLRNEIRPLVSFLNGHT